MERGMLARFLAKSGEIGPEGPAKDPFADAGDLDN